MPDYTVKYIAETGAKQVTTKIFAPSYEEAEKDALKLVNKRKKGKVISIGRDERESRHTARY
jgi:hypothetical protein